MNLKYVQEVLIPHRLRSIAAMNLAAKYILSWGKPVSIEISFNGKLSIEGLSTAFTNPVIESGIIHSRAILEFMGLRLHDGALANIKLPRRKDDIGIESFSNFSGPLPLISPEKVRATYEGSTSESEQALISILKTSNKALAHFTVYSEDIKAEIGLLEIASKGIDALMANNFYIPLGINPPDFQIKSTPRH